MKILCRTQFDITATGVTGHYKPSRIPFQDASGQTVDSVEAWNCARNQQRNWETITQLLSLRTQLTNIDIPVKKDQLWQFEFEIDNDNLFWTGNDDLGILKNDCEGVPMLTGLGEHSIEHTVLTIDQNIWFAPINNSEEQ
jgi:hypothetical protein